MGFVHAMPKLPDIRPRDDNKRAFFAGILLSAEGEARRNFYSVSFRLSCTLERLMLEVIFLLIVIIWLAGFLTGHTLGGLIHLLLLLALIVLYIQFLERHKRL